MELNIIDTKGKDTGRKAKLPESVFGVEPNDHVIYLDVKLLNANKRQGTHKSKQRNEISGSTRKLKRQKGTGGARAGSIKNPLFRGGGRIFGPQPRDYGFKLNKKVKNLARASALTYKAKENNIVILEDFKFDVIKTKGMIELLKNLKLDTSKTLLVLPNYDKNVLLSSRNLQKNKTIEAASINTFDILNAQKLVLSESSLNILENTLSK